MRKVCAKIVPKLLTPEQRDSRMNICADIDTDPGLLDTVITCDDKIRKSRNFGGTLCKLQACMLIDRMPSSKELFPTK
ncbi:hypothetical protein NQ318_016052 [Aromia moschata]|uniref:Uncharacterized protein n=1 Tax=Aromia moschata TaxID=1265417 RepID=A0AAV8Y1M0_9CUCU|nr:hypothetical protein NQ318_016052 [Aromia moschata]